MGTFEQTLTTNISPLVWICVGRLMEIRPLYVLHMSHLHVSHTAVCAPHNSLQKTGRELGPLT